MPELLSSARQCLNCLIVPELPKRALIAEKCRTVPTSKLPKRACTAVKRPTLRL